ncbi:extracellular matrix-binding ebh, putative [Babesia caballi]|uniref:Extracellular matrix-binding ebh, putative n=1 Tax=Babesia caballi TaxID=5871 RepID=A0AAV4LV43_BABCB|nr:extracellular matrix-binding ebh, putative [Babesia caballi]
MTSTVQKKSITEPPTNLKEAIDWVLRVSGKDNGNNDNDAIKDLADEVKKLFDKDAGEVAGGVLGVMGKSITDLANKLADVTEQPPRRNKPFKVLVSYLQTFKGNLENVRDYGSSVSGEELVKLKGWLTKESSGAIGKLAEGLRKFLGYQSNTSNFDGTGIILNNGQAYDKAYGTASWPQSPDDKRTCALIFLGIGPMLFYGLTYLYWNCESQGDWKRLQFQKSGSTNSLSAYLDAMGYKDSEFNEQKKQGSKIAEVLDKAFPELKNNASFFYPEYLRKLLNDALTKNDYPLPRCHIIASPYFTPNDTYQVNPLSAPVKLFPFDYSNLKEATDWLLRVTGRDGQDSSGDTKQLADAVKELLTSAIGNSSGPGSNAKDADVIQKLSEWLNKNQNGDDIKTLIDALANGLAKFIGFKTMSNNGLIGTDGIAVSNDLLERLRDGVLGFLAGFLGTLGGVPNFKADLNTVITALNGGVGKSKDGFEKALGTVATQLRRVNASGDIQQVVNAVKNVSAIKSNHTPLSTFATNVKDYFNGVLGKVADDKEVKGAKGLENKVQELKTKLETLVDNVGQQVVTLPINVGNDTVGGKRGLKKDIDTIYAGGTGALTELRNAFSKLQQKPAAYALSAATYNATSNFLAQLQTGYTSYYKGATWPGSSGHEAKCAMIFLGCLPLIFSNLQHLYWKCKQEKNQGGWKQMQLNGGDKKGTDLKHFMDLMAFSAHWLNGGKTGGNVSSVMNTSFKDLAAASATSNYDIFLKNLKNKATESVTDPTNNPLSALFYCSKAYFQCCHIKNASQITREPSTIREMLYFLAAMPYSTSYEALEKHIDTVLPKALDVADSGSSQSGNKLSADQLKEYLTASCFLSSNVLGIIQEPAPPQKADDPFLHDLFCNSMGFAYRSGASLLYVLSNYAYALQFQLYFLYQQCAGTYSKACGWNDCRYGSEINKGSTNPVLSHICKAYNCGDNNVNCSHNGTNSGNSAAECKHNEGGVGAECGKSDTPSPLQAFLTDNLNGFCRQHPGTSTHLTECSIGSMCHVPMGFNPNDLRAESNASTQGSHISVTLRPFCGGFNTPLRQLSEKLGCLTKRAPRSLGDLFGFTWHLNGQLFGNTKPNIEQFAAKLYKPFESGGRSNNIPEFFLKIFKTLSNSQSASQSPSPLSLSLEAMAPAIPFLYQLLMVGQDDFLPVVLFDLKGISHKTAKEPTYSGHHNDLYSLYDPQCTGQPCGPYLYPLTHSDGATYAPRNASIYLSWVLYLSDDLQSWFQEMLDEFKDIDCSTSGCKAKASVTCKCTPGQHGTSSGTTCSCPSVVQCGGTLPLLYRHGFRYFNPAVLMGGNDGTNETKRTCKAFADQLQSVITGNPLNKLLESMDSFLYAIRWEFFSKLSGFWTIYVCIILYTFFFLLDTLRVRSHLHFPSTNSIAPISMLGTGRAPALKKLTKLTYFIP